MEARWHSQLAADGYRVEVAPNRRARAHPRARIGSRSLVSVGRLEPPQAAPALVQEMRAAPSTGSPWDSAMPVIVAGCSRDELEVLRAFESGADDFISRTAGYLELRARIRAILRRSSAPATGPPVARGRSPRDRHRQADRPFGWARARAAQDGVRAARAPGRGPHARVLPGGAAAQRVGVPEHWIDAHPRQPRQSPARQARLRRPTPVAHQRAWCRLPTDLSAGRARSAAWRRAPAAQATSRAVLFRLTSASPPRLTCRPA